MQPYSFNISPIELKLGLWVKSGVVNIPTKFQENLRILIFCVIYALYYIFYLYGSEMYRFYRTKLYGPVMIKLYKESDIFVEIMGKS